MTALQFISLTGFALAGYSVVANDVIQTLGTFLTSNSKRHWLILWGYAAVILAITLIIGWVLNNGDVTYNRLVHIPLPEKMAWWFILPPLVLLVITQLGLPVSTTFLILSFFSSGQLIEKMIIKSIVAYAVAFVFALIVYLLSRHLIKDTYRKIFGDLFKVNLGLAISIIIALIMKHVLI